MSLLPDSTYRVDLRGPSERQPEDNRDAAHPPKVLQIRLTEQALQQLANAYSSSDGDSARIRIDVDPADPVLVIGDTSFPLHAPLPAAGSRLATSDAASTSTAPHELYQLSQDELTLHRIGTIATKLSVKPTRDVSAVAQRLKQQKEEEEHRKEERRKALMAGASPQLKASSSSLSGVNKTLASVRATGGSPSLASSPLSRSSSLNKLSSRREPSLLNAASLSRGVSREPSPSARGSSPAIGQAKLQGASYDAGPSARRTDRAITDSPKTAAAAQPRSSSRLHDPENSINSSSSSTRLGTGGSATVEEDGELSEDDHTRRLSHHSSPAAGASDLANGASKKTAKLTTRQRLAKATKAGGRLLAAAERRATPERRTALTATHTFPPSKLGTSSTLLLAESSRPTRSMVAAEPSALHPQSPPKAQGKTREDATSAILRKAETEGQEKSVEERPRRTVDIDRGQRASPIPISTSRSAKDESSPAPRKPAAITRPERVAESKRDASASSSSSRVSVATAEKESLVKKTKRDLPALVEKEQKKSIGKADMIESRPKVALKVEPPTVPVQVVTMRKARPSETKDSAMAKNRAAETPSSSRPSRLSDVEAFGRDRAMRADTTSTSDGPTARDARPASTSPTKQATRKNDEELADTAQRKRRRTNDFVPFEYPAQVRERRRSISPDPSTPRLDEGFERRREASRDGSTRRKEPASPRESQTRGNVPVSASMPLFASSSNRLQPVPEVGDRESRHLKAGEYHDRRRDRSYDEASYDDVASRDSGVGSYRDNDDGRSGRRAAEDVRSSSRGVNSSSSAAKPSSTSGDRPIKGVGPGAAHWSEPWLDVRSTSDWHRLAQRFAKTQEEYLISRKRLEAERERLDRELELASIEEQEAPRPRAPNGAGEVPAEQSLLFSPHKSSASNDDVVMRDLEVETAVNTSINSRTRGSAKAKPAADGNESPEEGEMRSSDDEESHPDVKHSDSGPADHQSSGTTSSVDSMLFASRRSESPDNVAWRSSSTKTHTGRNSATAGQDGGDRPLSYTDLANRVQQLGELHGSLSRMHRVLVDFKAKGLAR